MCINLSYCLVCPLFLLQDTRLCHGASKAPRTICICVVLRNLLCLLALLMSLKECSHSLQNECSICLKKEYKNWFERPQALHHGANFSTQDPRAYQYASIVSEGEKRGGQGGQRGKKVADGCGARCVQLAMRPGHQRAERRRGSSGRDASHVALQSARRGVKGGRGRGDRRPETQKPGKRGKGGRGRTGTQGAGQGQGAGAEKGSGEGGLPRKLLRTVLALAGGQRLGGGGEGTEA